MRIDKNTTIRLGNRNIVKIKIGDSVIWQKDNIDYLYVENTYSGSNTISVKQTLKGSPNSNTYAKTLQYSKDKTNWSTITLSSTAYNISLNQGERVYFRGNEGVFNYYANDGAIQAITNILGTQTHTIGGNINTLVNYTTPNKLTLPQGVFAGLFQNNTTITSAENLTLQPSSDGSLSNYAYYLMFSGCSTLITPPSEIPATKQGHSSCAKMFIDCIKLKTPPALKSTILRNYCFVSIFKNCTSLISAPELPATNLTNYCYASAFQGCSKLNNVTVYANDISATNCTTNWLSGVSSTGTFNNYGSATYTTNSPSGIPSGWTEVKPVVGPDYFYIESLGDGNTISVKNKGDGSTSGVTPTLEYSTDKNTWNTITFDWTSGEHTTELPVKLNTGGKMYFRNDTRKFSGSYNTNISFSSSVSSNVGGDIRTLSNYLDVDSETKPQEYMFQKLFYKNTFIVDASNLKLPYTTLENSCYNYMFRGCTKLTTAPELPATTLAGSCYNYMFQDCTSLTSAPELPATTLASGCYGDMFRGCTKLTTAPELPATTITDGCYRDMFMGCTKLTSAPELPATTLANECYRSMFEGCSSLTTAPELPATTLVEHCYSNMFYGCTSLTSAPELPATTLANYCYERMFQGCYNLTSAPTLPATTLASGCYMYMFYNCSRLKSITTYAKDISASNCTKQWLLSVASSGTFNNMGFVSFETGASGIPNSWTENIPPIQSITTVNPDTFTIEFNNETVTCNSTLTITTTTGITNTRTNSATLTVGENTGSTTRTLTETIPYKGSSYQVTIVQSAIQSITANPDTFTIKSYKDTAKCNSTLTIATTIGTTVTDTNSATITVGENTGDTTRTLTETIPYKGSSYQVTIVQTANDVKPPYEWNVESTGTYPFELNTNGYYESTNKGHNNSYSYATLNYEGFDELVLECINSGESNYDYGIISQPDVLLSESYEDDGATGSTKVFKSFKGESSTNPVQLTIPSDKGSHFITIKFRKDGSGNEGNDSLQFKVIEP